MSIIEIIVILVVALIVIPPENLPDVMRAAGKILRELRLASNMVVRELGGALDQPEDRAAPTVNTMKPDTIGPHTTMHPGNLAAGVNIAQSDSSAEAKVTADTVAESGDSSRESGTSTMESVARAKAADKPLTQG